MTTAPGAFEEFQLEDFSIGDFDFCDLDSTFGMVTNTDNIDGYVSTINTTIDTGHIGTKRHRVEEIMQQDVSRTLQQQYSTPKDLYIANKGENHWFQGDEKK